MLKKHHIQCQKIFDICAQEETVFRTEVKKKTMTNFLIWTENDSKKTLTCCFIYQKFIKSEKNWYLISVFTTYKWYGIHYSCICVSEFFSLHSQFFPCIIYPSRSYLQNISCINTSAFKDYNIGLKINNGVFNTWCYKHSSLFGRDSEI